MPDVRRHRFSRFTAATKRACPKAVNTEASSLRYVKVSLSLDKRPRGTRLFGLPSPARGLFYCFRLVAVIVQNAGWRPRDAWYRAQIFVNRTHVALRQIL